MAYTDNLTDRSRWTAIHWVFVAIFFGWVALVLSTAAFSWQEIVRITPERRTAVNESIIYRPRREGLFQACPVQMRKQDNCKDREYLYFNSPRGVVLGRTTKNILQYRTLALGFLAAGIASAVVAGLLSFLFCLFWRLDYGDSGRSLALRLVMSVLYFISGILYEIGLFFIHFTYAEEKHSCAGQLEDIFSHWPQELQRSTLIEYSVSYGLLWASLALVFVAAITIWIGTIWASKFHPPTPEGSYSFDHYRESLPRLSVQFDRGVEKVFLVNPSS